MQPVSVSNHICALYAEVCFILYIGVRFMLYALFMQTYKSFDKIAKECKLSFLLSGNYIILSMIYFTFILIS